jgi:hypothetical protein
MRIIGKTLLAILLLSGLSYAEVSFESSVDKLSAAYEDQIELTLNVKVTNPEVNTSPLPPPEIPGLSLGGSSSSVARAGDTLIRSYSYKLVPRRSGRITIPPFKLVYSDSTMVDTLSSEPITVNIAEPVPPKSESKTPTWLWILSLAIIIVGATWWYRRTVKARQPETIDWRAEHTAKLAEILKLAEREDYRNFSVEAMKLIVVLLEHHTGKKLAGHTTKDLVNVLHDTDIAESEQEQYSDLFSFCENVKYSSGHVDPEDGRKASRRLEKIVELLLK